MANVQRTYSARDLVTLPRLTGPEALTLVTALGSAQKSALATGVVSAELMDRFADLEAEAAVLENAIAASRAPVADAAKQREADARIDTAWSATRDWLRGWCKLPPPLIPAGADAYELYTLLFDQGLHFIQLEYKVEWSESALRLKGIADGGHAATFATLGGKAFLDELVSAQLAYGEALGITAAPAASSAASDESVGAALASTREALREYVAGVASSVKLKSPKTQVLADKLLLPLTTWVSKAVAASPTEEPADPPAKPPADPSTPTA